jgi:predicted ATPase
MANHFFKKLKFDEDFRCYKAGDEIEFKAGINLIVGEQGCGKSSLFEAIIKNFGILSVDFDPESGYIFLDTESMNPRLDESYKAHREFENWHQEDKAKADAAIDRLAHGYKEQSHGQIMLPLLLANKKLKRKTFFIDEPEAGLSIRSQYKVLNHYKELSKNNQLVIATHSPIFMKEIGEVLSLEHREWMPSDEFIELQKKGV